MDMYLLYAVRYQNPLALHRHCMLRVRRHKYHGSASEFARSFQPGARSGTVPAPAPGSVSVAAYSLVTGIFPSELRCTRSRGARSRYWPCGRNLAVSVGSVEGRIPRFLREGVLRGVRCGDSRRPCAPMTTHGSSANQRQAMRIPAGFQGMIPAAEFQGGSRGWQQQQRGLRWGGPRNS